MEQETKKKPAGRPIVDRDDRTHVGQVIRKYRKQANMDQAALASQLGFSKTAIGNWELGLSRPDISNIPKLCSILNIPVDELLGIDARLLLGKEKQGLLDDFSMLTVNQQKSVRRLIQHMVEENCLQEHRLLRSMYEQKPLLEEIDLAAGANIISLPDYHTESRNVFVRRTKASESSDVILIVNGDSMEPDYPMGCQVFVKYTHEIPFGAVGIFNVENSLVMKVLHEDCLYSLNRKRSDYPFTIYHPTNVGIVTGIVGRDGDLTRDEYLRVQEAFDLEEDEEGES